VHIGELHRQSYRRERETVARERKLIQVRVDLPLHQSIQGAAERDGRSISNWTLRTLEQAAQKQTEHVEQKRQQTDN
jgi:predicted HicB family RNase H-like nuclease